MRSPRSRSSINLYQRETVLCSWLGPRPVLSPQRARGHPSGEDEGSSVLGKHGPQSPASAPQRAKKVKPAARKKDEKKEKEKKENKKKNKAKSREKSRDRSSSRSRSGS